MKGTYKAVLNGGEVWHVEDVLTVLVADGGADPEQHARAGVEQVGAVPVDVRRRQVQQRRLRDRHVLLVDCVLQREGKNVRDFSSPPSTQDVPCGVMRHVANGYLLHYLHRLLLQLAV